MGDCLLNTAVAISGVSVNFVDSPLIAAYLTFVTIVCGTVALVRTGFHIAKIIQDVIRKRKTLDQAIKELDEITENLEGNDNET